MSEIKNYWVILISSLQVKLRTIYYVWWISDGNWERIDQDKSDVFAIYFKGVFQPNVCPICENTFENMHIYFLFFQWFIPPIQSHAMCNRVENFMELT